MTKTKEIAEQRQQLREEQELEEAKLNQAFALIFSGPTGELCLNYLVGKTLNRINGPDFNPNSLAHLEGQRFIVADIKQRILIGERSNL
jgi:hypothetical protein